MEISKSKLNIIAIIFLIAFFSGKGLLFEVAGQKQPLVAPSGNYTVEVPISHSNKDLTYPVWTPTIRNSAGEIVYTDRSSKLSGYHNSYWSWNTDNAGNDVLWIYNSDVQRVTIYYLSEGKWEKTIYDTEESELDPPEIIKKKIYRY